jgi:hypothetical protein
VNFIRGLVYFTQSMVHRYQITVHCYQITVHCYQITVHYYQSMVHTYQSLVQGYQFPDQYHVTFVLLIYGLREKGLDFGLEKMSDIRLIGRMGKENSFSGQAHLKNDVLKCFVSEIIFINIV